MFEYSFERLEVWKESIELVKMIYGVTKSFPVSEKYGLTSQLRRATVSISSNLAEGTSRISNKDKAHFTTLSFSSAMEVLNQILIAKELEFLSEEDYIEIRKKISKITNMLNSLRKSQINGSTNKQIND
ncbi:MAG: four helix bundle protein [Flavobacteriaceae bacterium]|nr:four helix bundle protein [Flavobacteriaceae bacterium]